MKLLPAAGLLLLGTALPVAAQTMKLPVAAVEAPVSPVRTQQYETVAQPDQVDNSTQATKLKFNRDDYDRMTVPVRVAGAGPYRFLVDTGADRTAISSELAQRLSLHDRDHVVLPAGVAIATRARDAGFPTSHRSLSERRTVVDQRAFRKAHSPDSRCQCVDPN